MLHALLHHVLSCMQLLRAMGKHEYVIVTSEISGSQSARCVLQELTLTHPNIVNAKKNTELTYGKGTFLSNHQ